MTDLARLKAANRCVCLQKSKNDSQKRLK